MNEPTRDDQPSGTQETPYAARWRLIRDVVALQFKLALDGVLDLLLSPVSIVAAIAGLIVHREDPGRYFYRVMRFGHKSDRWINLYGAGDSREADQSSDAYVQKVENMIRGEYERGGVVKSIKDKSDDVIDRLHKRPDQPQ